MIPISKPSILRKDLESVLSCMVSDKIGHGEITRQFENELKNFLNIKNCIVTNSLFSVLHLIFLALKIEKGDEIIISAYTDSLLLNPIKYLGATPVVVDIKENSFYIDLDKLINKITQKTKAIIVSHPFGSYIPYIKEFASLGIPLIEDITDVFGMEDIGKFSIFSFASFEDKMITTGIGAAIFSNNKNLMKIIKTLQYYHQYYLPDILSALGITQLKYLHKFIKRRIEIAQYYNSKLNIPNTEKNIYLRYPIKINGNLQLAIDILKRNNIESTQPIKLPIYKYLNLNSDKFPNAEFAYRKTLIVPIFPTMKKKEIETVANAIRKLKYF